MSSKKTSIPFNRGTGLLIIEVRNSNPNGDPDLESDPRTLEADGRGVISPVSLKRKLRDLVLRDDDFMKLLRQRLELGKNGDTNEYGILESRDRELREIAKLDRDRFIPRYWDARIFGNTMLEALQQAKIAKDEIGHFISTGVVQIGIGLSIAPIQIDRMTNTNIAPVELAEKGQAAKTRGMAPLGDRRVRHGVYAIPFFVNPMLASKTGATRQDLELFKLLLPKAYPLTASGIRSCVFPVHAWYAEHTSPWGSCPDPLIIDALMPRRNPPEREPSNSLGDYVIPEEKDVPSSVRKRLQSIIDLCETVL